MMKLGKIDLSNVLAISHEDDCLSLVIDRGDSLEVIEIPAPVAAYEGLQQLNAIAKGDIAFADFNELPGTESEIAMLPVHSTMANAVGYDSESNCLQVEFKTGAVYQYEDVDEETWEEMKAADSTGQFFNCNIKGYYRSHRID